MNKSFYLIFVFLISFTQIWSQKLPRFTAADQPAAPDYSQEKYWSALPFRKDGADAIPKSEKWINDSLKQADVFYIYPTLYHVGNTWCADVNSKSLNKKIDILPMKYQAAAFNRSCRIYSPLYRQAIIASFSDTSYSATAALDFAYQDIKIAFEYFLAHYNQGRPIVIVSHSQGTVHARQLLKDYFDKPEMKKQLVCAYAIGYCLYPDEYEILGPCENAEEINCFVTLSSFKSGYEYKGPLKYYGGICTNPLSWKTDNQPAKGQGAILKNISRKKHFKTEATIRGNYLWVKTNSAKIMGR